MATRQSSVQAIAMAADPSGGDIVMKGIDNAENMNLAHGKLAAKAMVGTKRRAALGDIGNQVSKKPRSTRAAAKPMAGRVRLAVPKPRSTKPTVAIPAAATKAGKKAEVAPPARAAPAPAPVAEQENRATTLDQAAPNVESSAFSARMLESSLAEMNIEDIDANDHRNPQMVTTYVNEIMQYMWDLEEKYHVAPEYITKEKQPELNPRMRLVLIDWLVEVHLKFRLLQETLYLAVHIMDRFLSKVTIERKSLQLVGVTAMLIASKYEEIYTPEVDDFVFVTDDAYSHDEILQMETLILDTLDYGLGAPLALHFLRRNVKAGRADAMQYTLAKYLTEITLQDYEMLKYKPSEIAASALLMGMRLVNNMPWTHTLTHYSAHSEEDLKPCVRRMAVLALHNSTATDYVTVRSKFGSDNFCRVSRIPHAANLQQFLQ